MEMPPTEGTDVFAFGVVMYECIAKSLPYAELSQVLTVLTFLYVTAVSLLKLPCGIFRSETATTFLTELVLAVLIFFTELFLAVLTFLTEFVLTVLIYLTELILTVLIFFTALVLAVTTFLTALVLTVLVSYCTRSCFTEIPY
jgi:hypothetical protein